MEEKFGDEWFRIAEGNNEADKLTQLQNNIIKDTRGLAISNPKIHIIKNNNFMEDNPTRFIRNIYWEYWEKL